MADLADLFVYLHDNRGRSIWVDPYAVVAVLDTPTGSTVVVGGLEVDVAEDGEYVMQMIEAAGARRPAGGS